MILHNLQMTCSACPTQWKAKNEQGETVYIRYRFDCLTVNCPCPFVDDQATMDMGPQVFAMSGVTGEKYRGAMDTEEMLRLTGYVEGAK